MLTLSQLKQHIRALQGRSSSSSASEKDFQAVNAELIEYSVNAAQNGQLRDMFNDLLSNPKEWLISNNDGSTILLPSLSECSCINSHHFDRLLNSRRDDIDACIFSFVDNRFPAPANARIHYMGFGGGNLLADFIIVAKLIQMGFREIKVSLIDPSHMSYTIGHWGYRTYPAYLQAIQGKDYKDVTPEDIRISESLPLEQFRLLSGYAAENGVDMTINPYPSIAEYLAVEHESVDVITALDLDDFRRDAFADIMAAHKTLHEEGRMFLSVNTSDYIFSADSCVVAEDDDLENTLRAGVVALLPVREDKTRLRIASLIPQDMFDLIDSVILPYIWKHKHITHVDITLSEPQEVNYFGSALGVDRVNENISADALLHYIQLFLPRSIQVSLQFIKGYADIHQLLPQVSAEQDFVVYIGKVLDSGTRAAINEVAEIHAHFPNADINFGINAYKKGPDFQKLTKVFSAEWLWVNREKTCHRSASDLLITINFKKIEDFYAKAFCPENQASASGMSMQ